MFQAGTFGWLQNFDTDCRDSNCKNFSKNLGENCESHPFLCRSKYVPSCESSLLVCEIFFNQLEVSIITSSWVTRSVDWRTPETGVVGKIIFSSWPERTFNIFTQNLQKCKNLQLDPKVCWRVRLGVLIWAVSLASKVTCKNITLGC